MESQRKTRIFDENDPAVIAAGGRHRKGASTASIKSTASTRQRTSQTAKRVALVDSTRHEAPITSNAPSRTSKGSVSQPAARGRHVATKSNASLATGAKSTKQPGSQQSGSQRSGSQQSATTSIKSTIYRDPQQIKAKGPVRSGQSHTSIGAESRTQVSRQKTTVFRDEPATRSATSSVSFAPEDRARAGPLSSKSSNRTVKTDSSKEKKSTIKVKETDVAIQRQGRVDVIEENESYETENRGTGWDDDDDVIFRSHRVALGFADKPCLTNFFAEEEEEQEDEYDEEKPVYNPMRQLIKSDGKLVCFPASGWSSHEKDTRPFGFNIKEDKESQEYIGLVENYLFQELEEEYLTKARKNGEGDRNRVYPRYTAATDLEVVQGVNAFAKNPSCLNMKEFKSPNFAQEYTPDIVRHMWAVDTKLQPDPHYMDTQPYLGWHMRGILVDWLIEVHDRFQMSIDSMFNTVNIIDRFLSVKVVPVHQLQLVGLAALLVAAKYDEITPPGIDMLVYMADHAYTGREIRSCEYEILVALEWKISAPGPTTFLNCLSPADAWDADVRDLAQYFLEAALTELRFVGTPWSFIAAASYYLSMIILDTGRGEWSPAHIYLSGHCASQLAPGVQVLIEMMDTPEEHHKAVFTKYNRRNYRRIAGFVERWMVAQFAHSEEPAEGKGAAYAEGREREREDRRLTSSSSACGPDGDLTAEEVEEIGRGLEELDDEESGVSTTMGEVDGPVDVATSGPAMPAEDMGPKLAHHDGEQCFYCSWGVPEEFGG
ncbi:hypothetical protein TWF594_008277 [Orbilia oligospora]|nr:hypothetical protein TWF594_008277 [Orbilia oligospora]